MNLTFKHYWETNYHDGENVPDEGLSVSALPKPLNAYGVTKRDGELAALKVHPGTIILRLPVI
jgi:dTDP-4-dehydrorhamnose reductase